jgi:hypothetical protein
MPIHQCPQDGKIAQPQTHILLKPTVTRIAAQRYGFPFAYAPRPA